MNALYAKQGRLTQFRTKAERDAFLRKEIDSIKHYRARLAQDLEGMRENVAKDKHKLRGIEAREQAVAVEMEERKEKMRVLGDDLAKLKGYHGEKVEQRKFVFRYISTFFL